LNKKFFVLLDQLYTLLMFWALIESLFRNFFQFSQHVFDYTHAVFITTKLINVLYTVIKELIEQWHWEKFYYFLNEMSWVVMNAELIKVLSYFIKDQYILRLRGKKWKKVLKSVSSLFVHDNVRKLRNQYFQNVNPSLKITNWK